MDITLTVKFDIQLWSLRNGDNVYYRLTVFGGSAQRRFAILLFVYGNWVVLSHLLFCLNTIKMKYILNMYDNCKDICFT